MPGANFHASMMSFLTTTGGNPSRTYIGFNSSTSSATSHTFSSQAIGTAATGRRVAVFFSAYAGTPSSPTSVTIGGSSASILCSVVGTNTVCGWAILQVDAGTTATIVVNWHATNNFQHAAIEVYALYDLTTSSAYATSTDSASTAGQLTGSMNVAANGIALCGVMTIDGTSPTWSRTAGPSTEDHDFNVGSSCSNAVYSEVYGSAQTPLSLDYTNSFGSGTRSVLAAFSISN